MEFNSLNCLTDLPKKGDALLINRKVDDVDVKILCKVKDVIDGGGGGKEVILSGRNDYFIWSMYMDGTSWVHRVWNLGDISITAITNTAKPFPRR